MKQRKIYILTNRHPEVSGGSSVVRNLTAAFQERGHDVEIISIYPASRPAQTNELVHIVFHNEGLQRQPASRQGNQFLTAARWTLKHTTRAYSLKRLRSHISRLTAHDVVIFTHASTKFILDESGYKRNENGPIFIAQHHSSFESLDDEPSLRINLPTAFNDCDFFLALTEIDSNKFSKILSIPTGSIPNPSGKISAQGDPESGRCVALARFSHEKQLTLMVELFSAARDKPHLSHWNLTIYGEGPTGADIEKRITALRCHDFVRLAGPVTDANLALHGAALNLLTSSLEGFGMTILEASRASIPSVAFNCSDGVREQMDSGAGWLVPPQDEEGYIAALRQAMTDTCSIAARGQIAQKRSERFTPSVIAARWETLWDVISEQREGQRQATKQNKGELS